MPVDSINVSDKARDKVENAAATGLADEARNLAYGQRAAELRMAEQMTKNPVIFAAVIQSSFGAMDKNRDGWLTKQEVSTYAAKSDIQPINKAAAGFLDKNFELMASPYGSRSYFAPQDLDEFRASLRLDSARSSEATDSAVKWGIGTYAVSKAFGSDQAGANAGAAVISSFLGSALLAGKRERFFQNIRKLNYFDIPESK